MIKKTNSKWIYALIAVAISMLIPLAIRGNNYHMNIFLLICGYVVLCNGLNILMGYSGQLSLGHAAFYGIGAYVCSVLRRSYDVNFFVAMIAAVVVCVLFGLILGLPACRQKGIFLALITSGFGTVINLVMKNWTSVTNGSSGLGQIPKLSFGATQIGKLGYCYIYLAIAIVIILLSCWIINSKIGRALVAVRDSEVAAAAMGINVSLYKCLAFALSAAMAGIAGCMYSTYAGYIDPTSFSANLSMTLLAMVILGGMGHLFGGVIGAIFVGISLELLRSFADYQQLIYGLMMVLVIRFMPNGLSGFFILVKEECQKILNKLVKAKGGHTV